MNDQTRTKTINPERAQHISFLLRLWCVGETWSCNWRASLEIPETGQRLGFATLEQLFIYLLDFCEGRIDIQEIKTA